MLRSIPASSSNSDSNASLLNLEKVMCQVHNNNPHQLSSSSVNFDGNAAAPNTTEQAYCTAKMSKGVPSTRKSLIQEQASIRTIRSRNNQEVLLAQNNLIGVRTAATEKDLLKPLARIEQSVKKLSDQALVTICQNNCRRLREISSLRTLKTPQ